MEYRIENKKIRIFPQHLEEIGLGLEGRTYKYGEKVLKLYHDLPMKDVLSYEECEYLSKLETERILLPDFSVLDKRRSMRGYIISSYIDNAKDIYEVSGERFLKERNSIHLELNYLAENFVEVDDFCLSNFICSDKFYLIDPGSYRIHYDMMDNYVEQNIIYLANSNIEYFDEFLYKRFIFSYIRKYISSAKMYWEIVNEFDNRYAKTDCYNKMDYISNFIIPDISVSDSIKLMVKKYGN